MKASPLPLGLILLLLGSTAWGQEQAQTPAYRIVEIAGGLAFPWSLAFLPGGELLVTERSGRLRIVREGTLDPDPIDGVPAVYVRSQGGLFDVVLHPHFERNRLLYLSYAHGTPAANRTRVARARFDGKRLDDLRVIFEVEPGKDTPVHYGGRMLFLADGTLLVTTGDGFDYREEAQNLGSLLGKTVRINDDGSIPADNPFVARSGARPEIWTYGHRNPQGLARDPASGRVYLHEHGPRGGDELNVLVAGVNYGWPVITYGIDYSGAMISPYTEMAGMAQPVKYWVPSIAPAGLAYYGGEAFPAWRGSLFVAALAAREVRRLSLSPGGGVSGEQSLFGELGERIRDVRAGPDGCLYLLTDADPGRVLRVAPSGDSNGPSR